METIIKKKSEALTEPELKSLKKFRKGFSTDVACAAAIGIDRNVLIRVFLAGSGSPDTVEKIRKVVQSTEQINMGKSDTK